MNVSELVEIYANAAGYDPARAANVARYLREGGVLPTGGRGPSAANAEPEHAFDLALGLTVSDTAASAACAVKDFKAILDRHPKWSPQKINSRLGGYAQKIGPGIFVNTARDAFGALIRAEGRGKVVSNLRDKAGKHIDLYTVIKWPLPVVEFVFGTRMGESPPYIFFGGTVGPKDPYVDVPREHSVALYPEILIKLAEAFRND